MKQSKFKSYGDKVKSSNGRLIRDPNTSYIYLYGLI